MDCFSRLLAAARTAQETKHWSQKKKNTGGLQAFIQFACGLRISGRESKQRTSVPSEAITADSSSCISRPKATTRENLCLIGSFKGSIKAGSNMRFSCCLVLLLKAISWNRTAQIQVCATGNQNDSDRRSTKRNSSERTAPHLRVR